MKIYDCFTFFNELDLLEIRLEELCPYVDYFVLVEANKTYSGKEKRFYFEENKKRFDKWKDQIIYVKVENMPSVSKMEFAVQKILYKLHPYSPIPLEGLAIHLRLGQWKTQSFQKNQIIKGLKNAKDEDIIIVSDLDEIPNHDKFEEMERYLNEGYRRIAFENKCYCYYLNGFEGDGWARIKACKFETLRKYFHSKPRDMRANIKDSAFLGKFIKNRQEIPIIKNGGWHFSYLGDVEKILNKMSSVAGMEKGLEESGSKLKIKKLIEEGRHPTSHHKIIPIKIDDSFPKTIRENKKKYSHLIKEVKKK